MENDDRLKQAIQNFMWVAHYNGYLEDVNDIYEKLKSPNEHGQVKWPEKWKEKAGYGVDEFGGIFWSWLVLTFGDYGTSPRFGWIEPENVQYLIEVFEDFKKDCDFANTEEW